MADDFFFGSFVGEKKQLARSDGRGQADHSAITENEYGGSGFGEGLAFVAAFDGACSVDGDWNFQRDGLRFIHRFGRRGVCCGTRVRSGSQKIVFFGDGWHGLFTREARFWRRSCRDRIPREHIYVVLAGGGATIVRAYYGGTPVRTNRVEFRVYRGRGGWKRASIST